MTSVGRGRPGPAWPWAVMADAFIVPRKERPLSKGNREVRKPKTVKPKVIAAAAPTALTQTLATRKK